MADNKASGALERELRALLRGDVDFGPGARALYATDSSNYRQVPVGVILPRDGGDVEAALAACRRHHAVVLPRGCGTSLAGQTCNEAVVFDFSRYMHEILVLDHDRRTARVQPGVVLDTLRAAAERRDLTFGPDPVTHNRCTLGGMIGNDSCGVHSVMSGKTVDNVHELDIVTYDGLRMRVGPTSDQELEAIIRAGGRRGEIYGRLRDLRDRYADLIRARFPDIPRRVSGFGLDQLLPENGFNVARALVGSEGTCVTVVEALLRLIHSPQARVLLVLGYPDIASAGDHVPEILPAGPIGLEAFDDRLLRTVQRRNTFATDLLPAGSGFLIAEFGADDLEAAGEQARQLMFALHHMPDPPNMALYTDAKQMAAVWKIREAGVGASAYTPGQKRQWPGWEDAGVPPDKVGVYLRDLRTLMDRYGYDGVLYGHFGQGCIHNRINFDFETAHGVEQFRRFVHEAAEQVVALGGSLSGEHGDGQARGELLPIMYGEELMAAFREFKAIWDPHNKMNPGKLIDAAAVDANLRLGVDYRPVEPATHFAFVQDEFSFAKSTLRCVGVGECRRLGTGTMCPSYMVTGEEKHSTRGRSRLLFEMLQRDPLDGGWNDKDVAEALDWCLACKGCKSDCPAKVDMATYKAEFRAHYYKGRPRPRAAYALGLIYWWSRLAAVAPGLANLATQTPGLRAVAKAIGGVAHERTLPAFAPQPFTKWFRERERRGGDPGGRTGRDGASLDLDDGSCDEAGTAGRLVADDCGLSPGSAAAQSSGDGDAAAASAGLTVAPDAAVSGAHASAERPPVLLWPDCFANYYHPDIARAAVEVLEAAGRRVVLPPKPLCCGRPLYDFGMLERAKRLLREILEALRPQIAAGIPMVGIEPSCVAVFRDELPDLFPHDEDAHRLSAQTFTLAEFLQAEAPHLALPRLDRAALLHGHCHHKSVMTLARDQEVVARLGLRATTVDAGCCGMAGSFGFERANYALSMAAGERVLLPAVRDAAPDTLILADGFSCREQIAQGTGRRALHLAEVVALALREGESADTSNAGLTE